MDAVRGKNGIITSVTREKKKKPVPLPHCLSSLQKAASSKLGMTALTVGAGLQGGEVTPLFGIGASLGGWIGQVTMGDPSLVAALGMVGVFGAALNVPITTIMLGIDMFGAQAAGYFVIVGFVSYLVAGHAAVYPAQRIVTPKRRGLKDDAALTVEGALERHRRELEELMDE